MSRKIRTFLKIFHTQCRAPQSRLSSHACHNLIRICAEIDGERCSLTIRLRVWERRNLPQRGTVHGGAHAKNGFYAHFRSERSHLEHPFQYFWAMAGPPDVAGPGKTFPLLLPLSTGLVSLHHLHQSVKRCRCRGVCRRSASRKTMTQREQGRPWVMLAVEFAGDTTLHGIRFLTRPTKFLLRRFNELTVL